MRKRSKYRPRPILTDPVAFTIESITPVSKHQNYLLNLKIKNSESMLSLMRGTATRDDIDTLVNMSNATEALYELGFGREYKDVCVDGRVAILNIVYRAQKHGKFTPTGEEIRALNMLMELNDAQMDVITVGDMIKAIALVNQKIKHNRDTTKLPLSENIK